MDACIRGGWNKHHARNAASNPTYGKYPVEPKATPSITAMRLGRVVCMTVKAVFKDGAEDKYA